MKKITKLLVVGLLSMVMVFSAAACSGTPVDMSNVEDGIAELETLLELVKIQQQASADATADAADAIAGVEAAIKAGDLKAGLAALATALTATNTAANQEAAAVAYEQAIALLEKAAIAKTGTATGVKGYGIVHNAYPAVASLNVAATADGIKVSNIKMEEYFFPHTYAQEHLKDAATTGTDAKPAAFGWSWSWSNTSNITEANRALIPLVEVSSSKYAEYIEIGGRVFQHTGATSTVTAIFTGKTATVGNYKQIKGDAIPGLVSKTIPNLSLAIARFPGVAEWYINAVGVNGAGFKVLRKTTGSETATHTFGTGDSAVKLIASGLTANNSGYKTTKGGLDANGSVYWNPINNPSYETNPLGWPGNIAAMEESFVNFLNISPYRFNTAGAGEWKLGGLVSTGATLSDFRDYLAMTQVAYINALTAIITAPATPA